VTSNDVGDFETRRRQLLTTDRAFYEYVSAIEKSAALQYLGDELGSYDKGAATIAWHASSRAALRAKVIRDAAKEGPMTS
jgi:hypothetical protein